MPPCPTRLTLSEQFALLRRVRAFRLMGRGAVAALLGLLLVRPAALHHDPLGSPERQLEALAAIPVGQCPIPGDEDDTFVADMDGDSGGPYLPRKFPKEWKAEPCPKDPRVRVIADEDGNRRCFVAFGSPPCGIGFEHKGECVMAGSTAATTPNTIRR